MPAKPRFRPIMALAWIESIQTSLGRWNNQQTTIILILNCRIHHVIASMTTIDLIINLGQAFWSRRPHFLNSLLRRYEAVHCLYVVFSCLYGLQVVTPEVHRLWGGWCGLPRTNPNYIIYIYIIFNGWFVAWLIVLIALYSWYLVFFWFLWDGHRYLLLDIVANVTRYNCVM